MPKVMFLATFCLKLLIVYYTHSSNVGRHMLQHQGRLKGKMSSLTKNAFALVPIIQIFFVILKTVLQVTQEMLLFFNRYDSLVETVGKKFSKKRKMLSVDAALDALSPSIQKPAKKKKTEFMKPRD